MVKSVNVCAKTAITASFQIKKSSIGTVKVKANDFIRNALLHSVFCLNSFKNRAYRLCKHYYKCNIGNYIGKRNRHSRRNSGNIPRQIKRAVIPKGCINIHKQRIQHSRNGTVNYSEHKTLFKLRSENSGYKPDYTPRKHLERCPWTLPKIKIRYYGGQRTRHKACLWAEIHRCYYNECRHRFYAGCPRKNKSADCRQRDHNSY